MKSRTRQTSNLASRGYQLSSQIRVPHKCLTDLDAFRAWCRSPGYPARADVFWLGGDVWIDQSVEPGPTHNLVRKGVLWSLTAHVADLNAGRVYGSQVRLANVRASLSCEPDAVFVSFEAVEAGRVEEVRDRNGEVVEIAGSPEIVLEVLSDATEAKDEDLKGLYYKAGVREYWMVDARGEALRFEILRRGPRGFVAVAPEADGLRSGVLGLAFDLRRVLGVSETPTYRFFVTA